MLYVLLVVVSIVLCGLAWFRFRAAIGFLILVLPTYLIRFKIGPLPSTFLELTFGCIFLVWLVRFARTDVARLWQIVRSHRWFFVFAALFLVGSLGGVGVSDMVLLSLGQWRAYFLEPMLLFLVLLGRASSENDQRPPRETIDAAYLLRCLILTSLPVALYGIFQWFTGWGIATPEWTAKATRRVTAFFTSPNAVGLYLESLLVITIGYYILARKKIQDARTALLPANEKRERRLLVTLPIVALLQLLGIFFTKSDGTVLALGAAAIASLFLAGYKKIVLGIAVCAVLLIVLVPKIHSVVLFQDKSGENRLTLWSYSWEFFTASPQNFVEGAGVRQFFRKIQKPHYDVKKMERLIYPHNIILNFWSETGLLGLIGFLGMFGCLVVYARRILFSNRTWGILLIALLVTMVMHGMVDVPYFKNDLAMMFWIISVLFFLRAPETNKK